MHFAEETEETEYNFMVDQLQLEKQQRKLRRHDRSKNKQHENIIQSLTNLIKDLEDQNKE